MQKIMFVIILFAASGSLRCGQTGLTGNQDSANVQPALTTNPTPTNGRPSKEFLEHFDKGVNLSFDGNTPDNITKAIEEFKKAGELDQKDTVVFWRMAELYYRAKDYEGLADCYREILKRDPKQLNAQYGLARVLIENLKNYDEGLKEALIAKEKDASYPFLIEKIIGEAYEGMGDIPNAIKHYKAYLKDFRDSKDTGSTLYKNMQKKVTELEKMPQNSNSQN